MTKRKIIKDVTAELNGTSVKVEIHRYRRKGWKNQPLDIIFYNGRIITPYEQRVKGWSYPIGTLFRMIYCDIDLSALIWSPGKYSMFSETENLGGNYPIPIKDIYD